jgi:hypothetical protein
MLEEAIEAVGNLDMDAVWDDIAKRQAAPLN